MSVLGRLALILSANLISPMADGGEFLVDRERTSKGDARVEVQLRRELKERNYADAACSVSGENCRKREYLLNMLRLWINLTMEMATRLTSMKRRRLTRRKAMTRRKG